MGIFSSIFGSKRDPIEPIMVCGRGIVGLSLACVREIGKMDETVSSDKVFDAGAEIAALLMHLVDRHLFQSLGAEQRNVVYDRILGVVISEYSRSCFIEGTEDVIIESLEKVLFEKVQNRNLLYSQCESISPATKGSMLFALFHKIHKVLGKTSLSLSDESLSQPGKVSKDDLKALPEIDEMMEYEILAMSAIKNLNIRQICSDLAKCM